MTLDSVREHVERFDGLFVGGTLPWKLETAAQWAELARAHGKRCHVGRVGNLRRLSWARTEVKADSVDSCFPLWQRQRLDRFVKAVRGVVDGWLFG